MADQLDALFAATADNLSTSQRSPVLHTLAGGPDTVVIVNHPRWFSRLTRPADVQAIFDPLPHQHGLAKELS